MWRTSSLQKRGAAAARSGGIDEVAPVLASARIETPVPPAAVWQVLVDVPSWPEFLPGVSRAVVTSRGSEGIKENSVKQFDWVNGGTHIRSRVEVTSFERELTWTGTALWLVAVHRNVLEPLASGGCRLISTESMAGLGAKIVMPEARLRRQLDTFVRAIADEARRRCA